MSDSKPFELPNASEKLAFKFILDAQRETSLKKLFQEAPEERSIETPMDHSTELPPESEPITICGSKVEIMDPVEALPVEKIEPELELNLPDGKKYFRIGEVSEIIGVEPYVLRYWESEFKTIKPVKSSTGHRVYTKKDMETLHQIRRLLHVEKFSIKGAKQKLQEQKKSPEKMVLVASQNKQKETLKSLSQELRDLIQTIRTSPF